MSNVEFKPFERSHVAGLEEVFRSNIGIWFAENELPDLHRQFDNHEKMLRGEHHTKWKSAYDTMFLNGEIIGAGGFVALDELADLSWGMVHNSLHGQGFGKELLLHRIRRVQEAFPAVKSILSQTSPAAAGFFAKYGFEERLTQPKFWGGELDLVGMELSLDGKTRYQHPDLW
jgi:ribosomal protein S18 acetylase RimI-like enzyme